MTSSTQPPFESRFSTVDGLKIHYHDVGQGEVVILLHGGGPGATGISNYARNVEALAKTHRVIVVDFPGYGESDNQPIPGGLFSTMGASIVGLMDAIGIEKASFVGNSLGGGAALHIALEHPTRVAKLVLMGTGGSLAPFSPTPTEGLGRMLQFYAGEGPSREKLRRVIELLVYDPAQISDELLDIRYTAATQPKVVANPPLKGRGGQAIDDLWRQPLYTIQAPTLIVWGRDDRVVPMDSAFLLLKVIPNAQLHIFPKCGHWAQWEKADEFNELVLSFLARS